MTPSIGQVAYETYANHQHWVSFSGATLPPWSLVTPKIQAGWQAAARAVVQASKDHAFTKTLDEAPSC
jgi:hypothetical protein